MKSFTRTRVGVLFRTAFGREVSDISIIKFAFLIISFKIIFKNYFLKTADIGICVITLNYQRFTAIDFTKPYITVPLTFVTTKPGLKPRTWITITPFTLNVWISMALSFIVTTILVQRLYNKIHINENRIDSISISLIGALLQQCIQYSLQFY